MTQPLTTPLAQSTFALATDAPDRLAHRSPCDTPSCNAPCPLCGGSGVAMYRIHGVEEAEWEPDVCHMCLGKGYRSTLTTPRTTEEETL